MSFKSKRFLFVIIALLVWLVLIFVKNINAIEAATGLTIIIAPYLTAETVRKSE